MVPVTVGQAVDHGGWGSIALWLAALAADFALLSLSYRFGARASMRAKQRVGHDVRMRLSDRVVQAAGDVRRPPRDLLSLASSDADRVGAFAGVVASTIAAGVVLVAATVMLLRLSPPLGGIIITGTVIVLVVQHRVARLLLRRSGVEQGSRARATALAEDLIRGLHVLKGIGAERAAARNYVQVSQDAARASAHAVSSRAALTAVGSAFAGIYLTAIAGIGGWLALSGHLGLGQLVAALGLAQFVIGPMQSISGVSAAYARALASAGRVNEVLTAEPAVADGATAAAEPAGGRVEFEGVALVGGARLLATVEAGRMTGLVCGDPAATAEVAALLAREHDPRAGRISLDGTGIERLPLETLRARVLVSPHDAALLPGTVADNVSALTGDGRAVAEAAWAAFADQVIEAIPGGADTSVGDRGETLSGGQRQRVVLARALASRPPVLVLHDPTTAVDAVTEDRIAVRVREVRAGRTSLVITTSPAWLSRCERVIYLHDGRCRVGTHARLLAEESSYDEAVAR